MTDTRDNDAFAEQLRTDMEASLKPVVDHVLADATRPWRRLVYWMGLGYGVLIVLSIVQWVMAR